MISTDYEVLGLTSGDWRLFWILFYIGFLVRLVAAVGGVGSRLEHLIGLNHPASVLNDYSRCRRPGAGASEKARSVQVTASSQHSLQAGEDRLEPSLVWGIGWPHSLGRHRRQDARVRLAGARLVQWMTAKGESCTVDSIWSVLGELAP